MKPRMGDLPFARLGYRFQPFSYCGLDYFGPLRVKVARHEEKRWVALFTCMTLRAIHIELVGCLTTDSVIMAIQRFTSRRGVPRMIYSDSGTNFKGANKVLSEALTLLDNDRLNGFCLSKKIEWRFNPAAAPHMGGAWESLIKSVKSALAYALKDRSPKEEVLLTVLTGIEHSVNSRPLTHVSLDPRDDEALTPNHFLIGSSSGEINFSNPELNTELSKKTIPCSSAL